MSSESFTLGLDLARRICYSVGHDQGKAFTALEVSTLRHRTTVPRKCRFSPLFQEQGEGVQADGIREGGRVSHKHQRTNPHKRRGKAEKLRRQLNALDRAAKKEADA